MHLQSLADLDILALGYNNTVSEDGGRFRHRVIPKIKVDVHSFPA